MGATHKLIWRLNYQIIQDWSSTNNILGNHKIHKSHLPIIIEKYDFPLFTYEGLIRANGAASNILEGRLAWIIWIK